MTIILGFIVGFLIFFLVDKVGPHITVLRKRFWDNPPSFFGYHIHHSFYGLLIFLVGFIRFPFLIGFGLGMIVSHTVSDKKLLFIEKINK